MDDLPDLPPVNVARLFDLTGRNALVTGSSRGLGWAMAKALAGAGAQVILNGRDAATLDERRERLAAWGYTAECAPFDVADAAAATAAIADIRQRHGRLDILISNAGSIVRKPLLEQTDEDWTTIVDSHLTAAYRLSREAARGMAGTFGRIIIVSSVSAVVARPTITGYVAAKAGLNGLVRALAVELGPHAITVNAIAPGWFPTAGNSNIRRQDPGFAARMTVRIPTGRWGNPYELGAAAVYLCSPAAAYTTGHVLTVDGGVTAAI
jgi:gluconate 5-dehydrogenase